MSRSLAIRVVVLLAVVGGSLAVGRASFGQHWVPVQSVDESEAAAQIRDAMARRVDFAFQDTPLSDVRDYLQELLQVNVLLDRRAMEGIGVQADTPVSLSVKQMRVGAALNHLLRPLQMAWEIRDDALVITAADSTRAELETRIYPVRDLVDDLNGDEESVANNMDLLADLIRSTVAPNDWRDAGGTASIQPYPKTRSLVIAQSHDSQELVDRMLDAMRKARDLDLEPGQQENSPTEYDEGAPEAK